MDSKMSVVIKDDWYTGSDDTDRKKILEHEDKIISIEKSLKVIEKSLSESILENLKLHTKILETELNLERTKNFLIRKNISFLFSHIPFSPLANFYKKN